MGSTYLSAKNTCQNESDYSSGLIMASPDLVSHSSSSIFVPGINLKSIKSLTQQHRDIGANDAVSPSKSHLTFKMK